MIYDGASIGERLHGQVLDPRELLVRSYPLLAEVVPPLDHVVLTARPLVARVNHGQWIASCDCGAPADKIPTPGGVVFFDRPLVWCVRCRNGGTGRGWRPVTVPSSDLRTAVEAVLVLRPDLATRNWTPGETVAQLIVENVAHGVSVPRPDDPASPAPDPTRGQEPWPSAAARAVLAALKPRRRRPFGIGR
jgi:hypothetical protein